ncbi:LIP-domain-containing protein [Hesseltinella vesiculosa]|uniref:LIP-domain-containing protein n=1 Tax=Hesseltinella vesiculosa TaxID=101127 RepID=A0A1X2G2W4_9FUNG|nr:LIP-domain-containing protein [Hesseltinella vesiculosa]
MLRALAHAAHTRSSEIPVPQRDPFYNPPLSFHQEKPGTILRSRQLSHESLQTVFSFKQNLKSVHQLLFRTTDALDQPIATVVTVMVPFHANMSRLLMYNPIENADFIECAISYTLRSGSKEISKTTPLEMLLMEGYLMSGMVVAATDYEGPQSGYGNGKLEGQALLDATRALMTSQEITGVSASAEIQIHGYSAGAIPASWALQLQSTYAPDIRYIGAVIGGTLVDMEPNLHFLLEHSKDCQEALAVLVGLANSDPEFDQFLQSSIRPDKQNLIDSLRHSCLDMAGRRDCQQFDSLFTIPDFFNQSVTQRMFRENHLGLGSAPSSSIPILMYHASKDGTILYQPAYNLYKNWCARGSTIHFLTDTTSDHRDLALFGLSNAINFVLDRFNGVPIGSSCSEETVVNPLVKPRNFTKFIISLVKQGSFLLGFPVGPGIL